MPMNNWPDKNVCNPIWKFGHSELFFVIDFMNPLYSFKILHKEIVLQFCFDCKKQ